MYTYVYYMYTYITELYIIQLLWAHMGTLQQKTENISRNQHKSSVENASSNPSESVLCSPGKDASQEPHNEVIHYTLQILSKVSIQGDLRASWKSQAQNKKTTELSCCYSWVSAIFLSATIKAVAQKHSNPVTEFYCYISQKSKLVPW